jgi:hypothetical protein
MAPLAIGAALMELVYAVTATATAPATPAERHAGRLGLAAGWPPCRGR